MGFSSLGYVGVRARDLSEWADYGTRQLGLQLIDRSRSSLAFRMDDRKQRFVVQLCEQRRRSFNLLPVLQQKAFVARVVVVARHQRQGEAELRSLRAAHVDQSLVVDEAGEVVVKNVVRRGEAANIL